MSITPSIACIGIIGKYDNPLHMSIFPPYAPASRPSPDAPSSSHHPSTASTSSQPRPPFRNTLDFSFLLNASLDFFDAYARDRNRIDQDLGLLQRVDERLSLWGWLTGTGVKFVVVIDAWGKEGKAPGSLQQKGLERSGTGGSVKGESGSGKKGRDEIVGGKVVAGADVKSAFKALQAAYIRLLQNPFYVPDEHNPVAVAQGKGRGGQITSKKFLQEVQRIGEMWKPGMSSV